MDFDDLIPMNKSKKQPKEGDVFLVQPFYHMYYYGKVIQVYVQSRDSCVNGMNLIFIYDKCADDKSIPSNLDQCSFLIPPIIINKLPWSRGYFETIGNVPVTDQEKAMPFGFWSFQKKMFVDVNGNPLTYKPQCWSDYGLASYAVVGEKIQAALKAPNA